MKGTPKRKREKLELELEKVLLANRQEVNKKDTKIRMRQCSE